MLAAMTHDNGPDPTEGPGHDRRTDTGRHPPEARERTWVAEQLAASVRGVAHAQRAERLCETCVRILPVSGASISLVSTDGMRVTLCASDEVAAGLAEIQDTLGDGPSFQAVSLNAPVFATDLTTGSDGRRWPLFAPQATSAGAQAVYSLPLRQGTAVGTVDLYQTRAADLSDREIRVALHAADTLALALLSVSPENPERGEPDIGRLVGATAAREEVYQATGMVMVQLDVGADEALARIRARAFSESQTITELARDIIERTTDFHGND